MKIIELNGLKTIGSIPFNCLLPIPARRGSMYLKQYEIGYIKDNRFVICHEVYSDNIDSLNEFMESVAKNHSPYKPVCLAISCKVQRL